MLEPVASWSVVEDAPGPSTLELVSVTKYSRPQNLLPRPATVMLRPVAYWSACAECPGPAPSFHLPSPAPSKSSPPPFHAPWVKCRGQFWPYYCVTVLLAQYPRSHLHTIPTFQGLIRPSSSPGSVCRGQSLGWSACLMFLAYAPLLSLILARPKASHLHS